MGLDAKSVQVYAWKIIKVSAVTCYGCAQKRPLASGILLFFVLLYVFLPSVFKFLIYFSPLIAFIAVVHRVFQSIDAKTYTKNVKEDKKKNDGIVRFEEGHHTVDKSGSSSKHVRLARRRNVREEKIENYGEIGVEEKGTVFSASFDGELVDKRALVDEKPKDIREVKVESVIDTARFPDVSDKGFEHLTSGEGEIERESSEDSEGEDEEEAQEEGKKAVEWTEDDQKNLMDLGFSEIERNRRLESLIARRRARKLLSLQVRKTLMRMGDDDLFGQISSLSIPRSNPFLFSNSNSQFSPAPGSAPSVLLPVHNPFDLPYDPYEEKPNLKEDSFHQEFLAAQQKDTMLCRHDSFSLGTSLSGEFKQDHHERMLYHDFGAKNRVKRPETSKLQSHSGKEDIDNQNTQESSEGGKRAVAGGSACDHVKEEDRASEQVLDLVDINEEDTSQVHASQMLVEDFSGGSNSSSTSEANVLIFMASNEANLDSFNSSVPKDLLYDTSQPMVEKTRMDERFFYSDKRIHHTPSNSIASDLQVEVSEASSPRLTVDGNISSPEEESSMHNSDVEREIMSGSEDTSVVISHLSGSDVNESRSRELTEQHIIEGGFSEVESKPDHIAAPALPEKDSTELHSVLPSKSEVPCTQAHKMDFNPKIYDKVQTTSSSDPTEALQPKVMGFPVLGIAKEPAQEAEAQSFYKGGSRRPKDLCNFLEKSDANWSDLQISMDNDVESLDNVRNMDIEGHMLINQESSRNPLIPTEVNDSAPIRFSGGKFDERGEQQTCLGSFEPIEENNSSSSFEGEIEKRRGEVDMVENSTSVENIGIYESTQDREGEQSITEAGFSGASQSANDPVILAVVPELVVEQAPPTASSSSSPKSVLQPKFSIDQASLLSLDHEMHMEVQEPDTEITEYSSLQELLTENLTPTALENALHLTDDTALPSRSRDAETLQESLDPSMMSTEGVSAMDVANASFIRDTKSKERLKSIDASDGVLQLSRSLEAARGISKLEEENDSISTKDTQGMSEKPAELMVTTTLADSLKQSEIPVNPSKEEESLLKKLMPSPM